MAAPSGYAWSDQNEGLRRKNLETIEYYMTLRGPERRDKRRPLFTEDAGFELTFTADCVPFGKSFKEWNDVGEQEKFPDWGFYNYEIYQTQNPNRIFVECDGRGKMIIDHDTGEESIYENHYIISFDMEDGKIKKIREIHNPCCLMKALSMSIPKPVLG